MFVKNNGYEEMCEYIKSINDWQIFGTLTFKVALSRELAEKQINKFWKIIDRALFGNLCDRKNIKVKRLCFLQVGISNFNNHIHFVANTIDGVEVEDFIEILKYFWTTKISMSGEHFKIERLRNIKKASKYLMHEFYKLGNDTFLTCSNI
jgi:hypothetical protein